MRSMTGFGRGEASGADGTLAFSVEISSVNRKQFELKFNLPRDMASCEGLLRQTVAARISRGALTLREGGLDVRVYPELAEGVRAANAHLTGWERAEITHKRVQ